MSSPSITPHSPLSPQYTNEPPSYFSESYESSGDSSRKQSDSSQSKHTVDSTNRTQHSYITYVNGTSQEESSQTEDDQSNLDDEDLSSVSCDSIDDKFHLPRGRRPPPMIVSQEDLPGFVASLSPKNSLKRLLERTLELDERYENKKWMYNGITACESWNLLTTNVWMCLKHLYTNGPYYYSPFKN